MYKTAYLKLLIIDKVDIFLKKLQKSIAKCSKVLYIKTTKTIKLQNRSDGMTKTWNRRKIWHH